MTLAIRHLPFFIAAAEEESFQRAAERLHIVQPALARRIKQLEIALGVPLFDRHVRGVKLNAAGKAMLEESLRTIEQFEFACNRAIRASRGEIGVLRVGLSDAVLGHISVSRALWCFRDAFPSVTLQIKTGQSPLQIQRVREGDVDIGLVYLNSGEASDLCKQPISSDEFVLVIRKDHELAKKQVVLPSDLDGQPLLAPEGAASPFLHERFENAFRRHNIRCNVVMEYVTSSQFLTAAEAGVGIGFLNETMTRELPSALCVRPVKNFVIRIDLAIVWMGMRSDKIVNQFRELLAQSCFDNVDGEKE